MHHWLLFFCAVIVSFCTTAYKCSTSLTALFLGSSNTGKQTHLGCEKANGQSEHFSESFVFPASLSWKCLLLRPSVVLIREVLISVLVHFTVRTNTISLRLCLLSSLFQATSLDKKAEIAPHRQLSCHLKEKPVAVPSHSSSCAVFLGS